MSGSRFAVLDEGDEGGMVEKDTRVTLKEKILNIPSPSQDLGKKGGSKKQTKGKTGFDVNKRKGGTIN